MPVHFIHLHLEDAPGSLAEAAMTLAEAEVNIQAFVVDAAGARFLTRDPDAALAALDRAGHTAIAVEALAVDLPDEPGSLARLARGLADAGINIHTVFAVDAAETTGRVYLRVDRPTAAQKALAKMGYVVH